MPLFSSFKQTQTAFNHMEVPTKSENHKNSTNSNPDYLTISSPVSYWWSYRLLTYRKISLNRFDFNVLFFSFFLMKLQSQTELMSCPTEANGETVECKQLPFPCIKCSFNLSCIYGKEQMVTCSVANPHVVCNVSFDMELIFHRILNDFNAVFSKFNAFLCISMLQGPRDFQRSMICRYCWQTEAWEHSCILKDGCNSANQIYL